MTRKTVLSLILLFAASSLHAAHITDKLLVGFYEQPNDSNRPQRILTSGTAVEVLKREDTFSQVRLGDGSTGWVKSTYITEEKPAKAQLLELQAKTGALQQELQAKEQELQAARAKSSNTADPKLQQELATTKRKLIEVRKEIAQLQESHKKELEQQKEQLQKAGETNKLLQQQLAEANKNLLLARNEAAQTQGHSSELAQLQKTNKTLQQQLAETDEKLRAVRDEAAQLKARSQAPSQELAQLEAAGKKEREQHEAQRQQLEQTNQSLQQKLAAANKDLLAARNESAQMKALAQAPSQEAAQLEEADKTRKQLEAQQQQLEKTNQALQEKLAEANKDLLSTRNELNRLRAQAQAPGMEGEDTEMISALERELALKKEALENKNNDVILLREQLKTLSEGAAKGKVCEVRISQLEQELATTKQTLSEKELSATAQTPEIERLQTEIGIMRNRIAEASDLLKSINEQPLTLPEPKTKALSWWWYLLIPLFATIAFVAGFAFKHYRISRRYGGFRL